LGSVVLPSLNEPDTLSGRQGPASEILPHSPIVGVHGKPPLQLVVLLICHPPMIRSVARPALPRNRFPRPNGSSYTVLSTKTCVRVNGSGPHDTLGSTEK